MKEDKIKKLQAFLAILPDKVARQLAVAIEYDRLDGGPLPHDLILAALRPALKRTGLKRQGFATVQRSFFDPIEDLFTASGDTPKRQACIARSSLTPFWRWLEKDLLADAVARASRDYAAALKQGDARAREAVLSTLWREAHQAVGAALGPVRAGTPDHDRFVKLLGSVHALEDAREMGELLAAAPAFAALRAAIPRGTKRLTAEELALAREAYDRLMTQLPDQAAYMPVLVLRRLSKPANVMELLKTLARTESDSKVAETTLGMAGDLVLDDFEEKANYLINVQLGEANAHGVLATLEQFADISGGLTQSLDIRRDGRWGKRLVATRNRLSEAMERRVEKLPDEIIGAFPLAQSGGYAAKSALRPNIGRWPDDAKIERAANLALFMGGARHLAGKALFGMSYKAASDRLSKFLSTYGEDLIHEIKAGDPDSQARCQAHLQAVLRIIALIMSEQDADILRRRAAMAAGQPAGGVAVA
jgi:hypothetical protein